MPESNAVRIRIPTNIQSRFRVYASHTIIIVVHLVNCPTLIVPVRGWDLATSWRPKHSMHTLHSAACRATARAEPQRDTTPVKAGRSRVRVGAALVTGRRGYSCFEAKLANAQIRKWIQQLDHAQLITSHIVFYLWVRDVHD